MIRFLILVLAIISGVASATPAFAHAALLRTDPSEGAVLDRAPRQILLVFNEPVSPVDLRLTDAPGSSQSLNDFHVEGSSVVLLLPDALGNGTKVLSWRVISADAHPIAGTLVFSIGAPSDNTPTIPPTFDPLLGAALFVVGWIFLAGMIFGNGGAFFLVWLAPTARSPSVMIPASLVLAIGVSAGVLMLGLQGLDTLGRPIGSFFEAQVWRAGFSTSYGATWAAAELALLLAAFSLRARLPAIRRASSAIALLGVGVALSLSGHASDAPPRNITWALVFLHGMSASFWAGSLLPLAILLSGRDRAARPALRRFGAAIPFAILPLVVAGSLLAIVQLTKASDLWTTPYGAILTGKLVAVSVLFALAFQNRFRLTTPALAAEQRASRSLIGSIRAEWALMLLVLALVAFWRLTPPPRSLFAVASFSGPLYVMPASSDAMKMANLTFSSGRLGANDVVIEITDRQMTPKAVKGVSLSLANPGAGIGEITRQATSKDGIVWRVDAMPIPAAGRWKVTLSVLISEFEAVELGAEMAIAP